MDRQMIGIRQRPVCKTPDLCIIACPYNRILDEFGEPVCDPPLLLTDGEDIAIEIVFADARKPEESS